MGSGPSVPAAPESGGMLGPGPASLRCYSSPHCAWRVPHQCGLGALWPPCPGTQPPDKCLLFCVCALTVGGTGCEADLDQSSPLGMAVLPEDQL